MSWRGQLPGTKVESSSKFSRNDLKAVLFDEACEKDRVLKRKDVDLVMEEEFRERRWCEPIEKKPKRGKSSSLKTSCQKPLRVWEVEETEDYWDLQLRLLREEQADILL